MWLTFKRFIKKVHLYFYWKKRNKIEGIEILNYSLSPNLKLGKKVMIRNKTEVGKVFLDDYSYLSGPYSFIEEAKIGKFCSIARNVTIGVSGHNMNWVTTSLILVNKKYDFIKTNIKSPQKPAPIIGNDVWIGMNSIVMRGVVIGDGAIVAAGSIVTKDVEPYSIVAGSPARIVKYRFSKDIIYKLLQIRWWEWSEEKIKENLHLMYDVDSFVVAHSENY